MVSIAPPERDQDSAYRNIWQTGPDTLSGKFLRRFWTPVYRASDIKSGYAVPIKILSERFTLYRGESGTPHIVGFRCAGE